MTARDFGNPARLERIGCLRAVCGLYECHARMKRCYEGLVSRHNRKDSFGARERNRYRLTIEEILSDVCDSEVKGLRHTELAYLINRSLHVEGRLWLVVMLALDNLLEAAHGLFA